MPPSPAIPSEERSSTLCCMIRLADPLRDYPEIARLRSLHEGASVTSEDLAARDRDAKDGSTIARFVAEADGGIVGAGHASHSVWRADGVWDLMVCVEPPYRRRGIGQALLEFGEAIGIQGGARDLRCRVADADAASLEFGLARGYERLAHSYESTLDLTAFDKAPPADPFRYFAFSETAMGVAERRKLWRLNTEVGSDEPQYEGFRPSFEEFEANVIEASWFDPEGQIFAADGDEWVGMSAVGQIQSGEFYNLFTGVQRSHRGQGIAKALKIRTCLYAKSRGAHVIRTNNDSRNAPMLAINGWLGYRPHPGWIALRKGR